MQLVMVDGKNYPVEPVRVQEFVGGVFRRLQIISVPVDWQFEDGRGRARFDGKWWPLLRNWKYAAINVYRSARWGT